MASAQADSGLGLELEVLSNRADLISGGDALVAVTMPDRAGARSVTVRLNGIDITRQFSIRNNGRLEGLVTGLKVGNNLLVADGPAGRDEARITNHPNGGPVFSGPQITPWTCQPTATDKQCNEPAKYEFFYVSSAAAANGLQPYNPDDPPADVATTTTTDGKTVPFIVRQETGYQNRDQYRIAVLYDPSKPFTPWAPQVGFNRKVLALHGGSCGTEHLAGTAPDVLDEFALGRGMAVMSTALDNAGHNCNGVVMAESLMMAKERLVEQYGSIRYTIGQGCSGGSLTAQQVSNSYPGIYQGIIPCLSFPDAGSTGQQIIDSHFIHNYLANPAKWEPGVAWDPLSIAAVVDHVNPGNGLTIDVAFWGSLVEPGDTCPGVTAEQAYNASSNPGGVRCTILDYMINVLGPRRPSVWGPQERQIGRGFAGAHVDNVAVQYGVEPLKAGKITPAQFVDLNAKIGGADYDGKPTAERWRADEPALANSYRSGYMNMTNNQDSLAVIDMRSPDMQTVHDTYRAFSVRARMQREQGRFPLNHVIWSTTSEEATRSTLLEQAIDAMDRWLAAVEADKRSIPLAQKIAHDRPVDVRDRCDDVPGMVTVNVPGVGRTCDLAIAATKHGTPRMAAGEPISIDQNKCALRPLRRSDYNGIAFTDAQWDALKKTFPDGVCDWSKPGVSQQATIPWLTYQDARRKNVYGGQPLGRAPASSGAGWASTAFGEWRNAVTGGRSAP